MNSITATPKSQGVGRQVAAMWAAGMLIAACAAFCPPHLAAQTSSSGAPASFSGAISSWSVSPALVGSEITIHGALREVISPRTSSAPIRFVLDSNRNAPVEVVFWAELSTAILGPQGYPPTGTHVYARGVLSTFQDSLQLKIKNASDIYLAGYASAAPAAPAPPAAAPANAPASAPAAVQQASAAQPGSPQVAGAASAIPYYQISDLPMLIKTKMNQVVAIRGISADYRASWSPRAPNIVYLREGANQVEVVYWPSDGGADVANFSQPGTPVFARGVLQNYQGRLQIKIENLSNLSTSPLLPASAATGSTTAGSAASSGTPASRVQQPVSSPAAATATSASAPAADKIEWKPYNLIEAQETLTQKGSILIYARSERIPRCQQFENAYLLRPALVSMIGARKIFFVDVDDPANAAYVSQLRLNRVPSLVLIQSKAAPVQFLYEDITTPAQVVAFLNMVPR